MRLEQTALALPKDIGCFLKHPMSGNPLVQRNASGTNSACPAKRHRMFLKHPMSGKL